VRPRPEVWEQVVSENDNCLRARCPHYSTCFFYTARRAAAKADIVVVNTHLLMADLALRYETDSYTQNAVLPPAKRVIIDEAHHLEDVATSYFGSRLSYFTLERIFGRLQSTRDSGKGVLPALVLATTWYVNLCVFLAVGAASKASGSPPQSEKVIDYPPGLLERGESLVFAFIVVALPGIADVAAYVYAILEVATAAQRFSHGRRVLS